MLFTGDKIVLVVLIGTCDAIVGVTVIVEVRIGLRMWLKEDMSLCGKTVIVGELLKWVVPNIDKSVLEGMFIIFELFWRGG